MPKYVADHLTLAAEWHPTRNAPLTPELVPDYSPRSVWWRCPKGPDHEWRTCPGNRRRGSGCPFCCNYRASVTNCLATLRPALAAEWHPTRNGRLRPSDVTVGANRKVWWRCPRVPAHEWAAVVGHRSGARASGCPFCAGRRVSGDNSLAARSPAVAAEWHPTRNRPLTPADVTTGSGRRVWWKCPEGDDHEWIAAVSDRKRFGCGVCSGRKAARTTSLAAVQPRLAAEWHPRRNGDMRASDVVPGSNRKVWWLCAKDGSHEWQAVVQRRAMGHGCPFCAGRRVAPNRRRSNSLVAEAAAVAKQWHPTRNGNVRPEDVLARSYRRFWWKCPAGPDHEWQASARNRTRRGAGCPSCGGRQVSVTNALASVRPDLAREWHPTRNGALSPWEVTLGSHREVWWRCARDRSHEWQTTVHSRQGCPYCSHLRTPPRESLARLLPHIARQWHPTKNGKLRPADVVPGSNRRVWWKCPKSPDHEWQGVVSHRTRDGTRCPFCIGKRLSVTNSLATRFATIAAEWHPRKNARLTAADVKGTDKRRVWWKCPKGPDHEWQAPVFYRSYLGLGCPFCAGRRLSVTNCLATKHPRVAARWHPTLNAPLTAQQLFPSDTRRVWWRCERRHEWQASVRVRVTKQGGCPICYAQRARVPVTRRRVRETVRLPSDYS